MPGRVVGDPMPSGPRKGVYVKPKELRLMIDDHYQARGWMAEGLIPKAKLIALGLEDIGVDDVPCANAVPTAKEA